MSSRRLYLNFILGLLFFGFVIRLFSLLNYNFFFCIYVDDVFFFCCKLSGVLVRKRRGKKFCYVVGRLYND